MAQSKVSSRVWLVTGCSTGIGRALAERVLQRGYRCVVTARDPASVQAVVATHASNAMVLTLDVTDRAQLEQAVGQAETTFGAIDVLVNNAGYGYNAAVEEADEQQVRAMFETNFFGLSAMMRQVLPGMRARGSGHIFNVSSVGGLIGNAGSGFYCASKFAVEGLTQALAKEVAPLGIKVTLIEPGAFRTDFQGRSIKLAGVDLEAYADTAGARRTQLRASSGKQAGDPVRAADAIIDIYEMKSPPLQVVFGKAALGRLRESMIEHTRSINEMEKVTLATDFPQA